MTSPAVLHQRYGKNALSPRRSALTALSTEGVLLALIILISQKNMTRQADRRAHLNLQIGLLAEQEITLMLHLLQRVARHLGVPDDPSEAETNN